MMCPSIVSVDGFERNVLSMFFGGFDRASSVLDLPYHVLCDAECLLTLFASNHLAMDIVNTLPAHFRR